MTGDAAKIGEVALSRAFEEAGEAADSVGAESKRRGDTARELAG